MKREEDLQAVAEAKPDMVGFIIGFPKSRRNVSPARAVELCQYLDALETDEPGARHVAKVGVFVNEPVSRIADIAALAGLDYVQLHGSEDERYLENLRFAVDLPIIQAFTLHTEEDALRAQRSSADLVLLDNGQGTGRTFDWSLARRVTRPFLLAGGLTPRNVGRAVREVRPWGVDMSSGLETDGMKDPEKIRAAVAAVRRESPRAPKRDGAR